MKSITCSYCQTTFERYNISAKRAARPQFCKRECQKAYRAQNRASVADRFWAKVDVRGQFDCWEWQGHRRDLGYGWFNERGVPTNAHRVAYKLVNGDIPSGLFVCHSCDNPPCCNPAHLWLGTCQENTLDMVQKGRSRHRALLGEEHPQARLTVEQVLDIYRSSESNRALGVRYGVSATAIHWIKAGKKWAHITRANNAA